jgi:carbon starvation protein
MNAALLLIGALPLFIIAYRVYGRRLARIFGEDASRPTPAIEQQDGKDYVPTRPAVLFGHHFASIAGGGPVVGPTVALIFGYGPAWLWIVVGAILIGGVHDFASLFVSMRERGRSIAEIAGRYLGRDGFVLFIAFAIVYILLVTSAFLQMTATALTSLVPADALGMGPTDRLLKTVVEDGVEKVRIGGIASTSVIVITAFAPLIGWLLYRKRVRMWPVALAAVVICVASIRVGLALPVTMSPDTWMLILSVYVFFACGIPVWMILQPRDFTNSFILYGGIMLLLAGAAGAGVRGVELSAPAFETAAGRAALGPIWPFLFITIACGAISGFHALVASGTTSKQITAETHARRIGYGGMLLEGVLAVCVVTAVASGMSFGTFKSIVFPEAGRSNPILGFALGMGGFLSKGLGLNRTYGTVFGILMVEGFVVTTLDTAVRLNRYLLEDLWKSAFKRPPAILRSYYFNSLVCVVLMLALAKTNAFLAIWPVFGSANQLLAALTLMCITIWLKRRGKPFLFALFPALFMLATTTASLLGLLRSKYIPEGNLVLAAAAILLLGLSVAFIVISIRVFRRSVGIGQT